MKPIECPFKPLMGRTQVDRERLSFREQLWDLCHKGRIREWDEVRLIFADWLEDQGDMESYIARARWICDKDARNSKGGIYYQGWRIVYENPAIVFNKEDSDMTLLGKNNALPILGFDINSLKYTGIYSGHVRMTFVPRRSPPGVNGDITRANPFGLPLLFAPEDVQKKLFEEHVRLHPSYYDGIDFQWWQRMY